MYSCNSIPPSSILPGSLMPALGSVGLYLMWVYLIIIVIKWDRCNSSKYWDHFNGCLYANNWLTSTYSSKGKEMFISTSCLLVNQTKMQNLLNLTLWSFIMSSFIWISLFMIISQFQNQLKQNRCLWHSHWCHCHGISVYLAVQSPVAQQEKVQLGQCFSSRWGRPYSI